MEMNQQQLKFFNATHGAWSVVTGREAGHDKSVTLDKHEVAVLARCISLDKIKRMGGGEDDGNKPKHWIWVYGTADYHELAIKYPKRGKTELRLYMSRKANFYGAEGDVFFINERNGVPCVGFMNVKKWAEI